MKKTLAALLSLCMTLSLAACGSSASTGSASSSGAASASAASSAGEAPVEVIVFAAASMTETLNTIIDQYKDVAPNVTITATYDSSGKLKTQMEEGAPCDLFISAAQTQMNALDGSLKDDPEKNPDGLDLVLQGSRVNLLENKVTLVVPEGNPAGIESFSDLASNKLHLMALGNSDVPVGSYSLDILSYLGLNVSDLEAAGKITYCSNVKEVTTQVTEGSVDCGIIYATDAYSAGLTVVDTATSGMCKQVIYPAAVMNTTTDEAKLAAAQDFLDYLQTDACAPVFESVGFSVIQ